MQKIMIGTLFLFAFTGCKTGQQPDVSVLQDDQTLGACVYYGGNVQGEPLTKVSCVDNSSNPSANRVAVNNGVCKDANKASLFGQTSRAMFQVLKFHAQKECGDRRVQAVIAFETGMKEGACALYASNQPNSSLPRINCADNKDNKPSSGSRVTEPLCKKENSQALFGSSSRAMYQRAVFYEGMDCGNRGVTIAVQPGTPDGGSSGAASSPVGACAYYAGNVQGEPLRRQSCVDNDRSKPISGIAVNESACRRDNTQSLYGSTSRAMYQVVKFTQGVACDNRAVQIIVAFPR